ncbi:hypothetical protein ScPMuIL_019008 [Solemya velum]
MLCILTCVWAIALVVLGDSDQKCKYEFSVPQGDFQCGGNYAELQSNLGKLEGRVHVADSRMKSISDVFVEQMTSIKEDVKNASRESQLMQNDLAAMQTVVNRVPELEKYVRDVQGAALEQTLSMQSQLISNIMQNQTIPASDLRTLSTKLVAMETRLSKQDNNLQLIDERLGRIKNKTEDQEMKMNRMGTSVQELHEAIEEQPPENMALREIQDAYANMFAQMLEQRKSMGSKLDALEMKVNRLQQRYNAMIRVRTNR